MLFDIIVCDKMKEILKRLDEGEISIEECETLLKAESIRELDDVAKFDSSRKDRTGFPEAILAESKDYDDLLTIIKGLFEEDSNGEFDLKDNIIITRLSKERFNLLNQDLSYLLEKGIKFDYNPQARILIIYKDKLVDFKNFALIKSFTGHNNEVCTIKKFIHPEKGECLIAQEYDRQNIFIFE